MELGADRNALEMMCQNNELYSSKFSKCVQPIMDYFNCSYVHFDCVTYSGRVWGLHTDPELFRYYILDGDGFRTDPLFRDVRIVNTNIFIWPLNVDGSFRDDFNKGLNKKFDVSHGITFMFHDKNAMYSIALSSTSDKLDVINLLIKEQQTMLFLKNFILENMKKEINSLERNMFNAAHYVGEKFYMPVSTYSKPQASRIDMLLETHQIKEQDLEYFNVSLTPRERQCAVLYLNKHTMDEISIILGISQGACRKHMHRIKKKFNVNKKQQFMDVLHTLSRLDYFQINELSTRRAVC